MHGHHGTPPACRNKHRNGQLPISCQVVARSDLRADWSLPISVLVWVRSFIEPDLFDNCSTVPLQFMLSVCSGN